MNRKSIVATTKSLMYTRIVSKLAPALPEQAHVPTRSKNGLKIAIICDPMTWENMCQEQVVISLSPKTWQQAFEMQQFDFFFCEAAWSGVANASWRGQIYKDGRVFYENRRELLKILAYCKSTDIPSVFWAKEDPTYFQDAVYDFTDTALKFDYILTTAEECIPKYHELGHTDVHLWSFGFSPELYFPPKDNEKSREKVAVFAGSWFTEHPNRCKELTDIFEMILIEGIPLQIYDRNRKAGKSKKPFPEKYQSYVSDAISYDALGELYRNVEFAININTVKDSNTMFSRRVYEAMACGCIVITNESIGLRSQFGDKLWFLGETFNFANKESIRKQNIETVFRLHTWNQRVEQLCMLIGDGEETKK